MTLQIGTRLGHYRIVSLLGRGGMADVYRAEDERLGREVALKALPPEFARDPERIERFEREVRAAARLNHPNIVTVYEFGQGEGQHFYTMALMTGGDLKGRIRAHPDGMPPGEARSVAQAMARALHYAHGRGFVHRDVKPENILFGEEETPQLTDFGIVRAMESGTRMTATGMSIGSPHYMSPEQAQGLKVDARSDLYSLGVVFYEMLTGRLPFEAVNTFAVAYSHINDPVPELPQALAGWQPMVNRLLAKSPEDRYGSARELADVLVSNEGPQALAQGATRVVRPPSAAGGNRLETLQERPAGTRVASSPSPGANPTALQDGSPRASGDTSYARFGGYPRGLVGLLFSFKGRMGRALFWKCFGIGLVVTWIFHVAMSSVFALNAYRNLSSCYWLLAIWPWTAVLAKRLHDLGRRALSYCVFSVLANVLAIIEYLAVGDRGWLELELDIGHMNLIGLVSRLFSIPMLYAFYLAAIKEEDDRGNDFSVPNPRRRTVFRS